MSTELPKVGFMYITLFDARVGVSVYKSVLVYANIRTFAVSYTCAAG